MASERHVSLIKKIIFLLLSVAIIVGVWYFEPEKLVRSVIKRSEKREVIPGGIKPPVAANAPGNMPDRPPIEPEGNSPRSATAVQGKVVTILHCHLPGNAASEQMADVFNLIQKKYGKQVKVIRAGFPAQPVDWQKQNGISLPYVIMIVDSEKAFQFQGLMALSQVEKKVEELIFGVRRVGKDWRPAVPGMMPKSN